MELSLTTKAGVRQPNNIETVVVRESHEQAVKKGRSCRRRKGKMAFMREREIKTKGQV